MMPSLCPRARVHRPARLLTAILLTAGVSLPALTLIEDGRPGAVIVTADSPTRVVRYAVEELNRHLGAISGTPLPVLAEGSLPPGEARVRVLVGDTAQSRALGLRTADLEAESTVVKATQDTLFLIGGDRDDLRRTPPSGDTASGTLYAVYELLERDLGVRWLWPGANGTVIPSRGTVRVAVLERRFQPPLIQRHIRAGWRDWGDAVARLGMTPEMSADLAREYTVWTARRRLGRRATFRFGHAYNYWLRDYGADHPDWFAMMPDGSRVTPEQPYPSLERAKLCVTNPELLDFIAARGMEFLEHNPETLSFSACPNDSRGYCMCPRCKALDPLEGLPTQMNYPGENFLYPSLSDRYVWFWNQLAQRLGDRYPGRYIGAYAYSNYNHPPLREKLSPRVIIAYVGFNYLSADYCEQSRGDWAGWAATGCKLYLRPNLLLVGHGFPLNYARELGRDLRQCFQTGMLGTDFDSMTHHYAAQAPIFYVLTGLLWDPQRDVEDLLEEFHRAAYGPAAAPMRRYWDRVEEITREIGRHRDAEADHDRDLMFHEMTHVFYSPERIAELREMLLSASAAAAGDAAVVARIEACETALTYAEIQRDTRLAVQRYKTRGDNLEAVTAALQRKQAFLRRHLGDWTVGLHHIYWREERSKTHQRLYGGGLAESLTHPRELARLIHWRFQTDPEAKGEALGWQRPEFDDSGWAAATSLTFWEQQGWKDYDGVAWYRCRLPVAREWAARRRLVLHFGAVDESFRLYIDGRLVHESLFDPAADPDLWKKPRTVDVTDFLKPGAAAVLAVRVHDSAGAGGLWKPAFVAYEE
ncbi:MAG: DUF4838 domain-containing protein [Lentisphaeria bacterium]|nr:DUF4838 domain-containing protein [Lentisphaeria bacterium]